MTKRLYERAAPVPGFLLGLRTTSTRISVSLDDVTRETCERVASQLEAEVAGKSWLVPVPPPDAPQTDDRRDIAQWFARLIDVLQQRADMPFLDPTQVLLLTQGPVLLFIPSFRRGTSAVEALVTFCLKLLDNAAIDAKSLLTGLPRIFSDLRDSQPVTSNGPRLARAAFERGYAYQELPGSAAQYGMGCNSVVLDGTFTPDTSRNGAFFARSKPLCSMMLRRALLPRPAFGIPKNANDAVDMANRLGYPIVVKPADQDGGNAVEAGLMTDDQVRSAYQAARSVSNSVMVERHVKGRDYRLTVFRGEMIWAIERRPAGVTGDGTSSIRELVAIANAQPGRGEGEHSRLKLLKLDDDAQTILKEQALTDDEVPLAGQFVRLARRSNITAGGVPVAVTDKVHPENARLAVRAAQTLGLDLAGIDLIIPEIERSWRSVGGGICEVNAMPEIGGTTSLHLYPWLLDRLVPSNGRIPVVAFLGQSRATALARDLARQLISQSLTPGLHTEERVQVGSDTIADGSIDPFVAGQALAGNREVDVLILGRIAPAMAYKGVPVPAIDRLIMSGEMPLDDERKPLDGSVLVDLLRMIVPNCRSLLLVAGEVHPSVRDALEQLGMPFNKVSPAQVVGMKAN